MLTIKELHHIQLLSESRNFRVAAARAGISQPALSQSIASAERKTGVPLFIRDRHTVEITDAGQLVTDHAAQILSQLDDFSRQLSELREARSGRVRFGIGPVPASLFLTQAIKHFCELHPQVYPSFEIDYWDELSRRVLAGSIAFFVASAGEEIDDRRLQRRRILEDRLIFLCRRKHPLAALSEVTCSDLVRFPLITYRTSAIHARVRSLLRTPEDFAAFEQNFPAAKMYDLSTMSDLTTESDYVMMVSQAHFQHAVMAGRFRRLNIPALEVKLQFEVVTKARGRLSPVNQQMVDSFVYAARQPLRNLSLL
jgi:DNA-binding transcriptional LysR family regulator